jgi:DNA-binding NarL/FixJ family response regulator
MTRLGGWAKLGTLRAEGFDMTQLAPLEPFPTDPTTGPRPVLPPDSASSTPLDLYLRIAGCELKIINHFAAEDRIFLVAESPESRPSTRERLTQRERDILCQLFAGQSQKAISYDLGLSPSTVATHAARAFAKLSLQPDPCTVPLALVLLAQAACGAIVLTDARVTTSVHHGRRYAVANLMRPSANRLGRLTEAERAVALALVEGSSKSEISQDRHTSIHTIGRQISGVFSKLDVKGRFELIRRMSE